MGILIFISICLASLFFLMGVAHRPWWHAAAIFMLAAALWFGIMLAIASVMFIRIDETDWRTVALTTSVTLAGFSTFFAAGRYFDNWRRRRWPNEQ